MGIYNFKLPDIGEGIAEAELVAWHAQPGDWLEEDAPLADLMTDKATVEMTAPVAGRLIEVAGEVGDQIAIGSILATFETEGGSAAEEPMPVEQAPEPSCAVENDTVAEAMAPSETVPMAERDAEPAKPEAAHRKAIASPAVRKRARELGIDLVDIKTSGDGRVRHADLDAFIGYNAAGGYVAAAPRRADEQVRVIGLRRRIAENMAASKRHIPHFSYVEEIDVTKLEEMRADLNAGRGAKPKLTMLPLLVTAICKILPDFPMMNARYDDEADVVTRFGAVHLGLATQTDAGLMVPVIRDAQDRNIWQLATEISRLADAARSGKARSEELSGSTLTITSLGPLGGISTTPVINRPEVAIIGPNRIVERPVFVPDAMGGERIAKRKLMNLSISCDHRVVDGWDAASFVQALKRIVESPALLFAP